MIELKQPTLRELTKRIAELSEDYDVDIHFEGKGDCSIKLVILDRNITLVPNSQDLINECKDEGK